MRTATERLAGWAMLSLGVVILAMWTVFLFTGVLDDGIRTVENNQYLIFHIAAEGVMGLILVVAGAAVLRRRRWAMPAAYLGIGMTAYSTINSLAHSVRNEPALTPVFLVSLVLAVALLIAMTRIQMKIGKEDLDGPERTGPSIPGSSRSSVA